MTRLKFVAAGGLVVAALTMMSCASAPSADEGGAAEEAPILVRTPLTKDASALDVLVAQDQGYFEEEGLDVQIEWVNDTSNLPQVTGKQYDITGVSAVTMINSVASGMDLVAVAGNRVDTPDNPTAGLIVPADSDIEAPEDLQGHSVGTPSVGGTLALATQFAIAEAGGDFTQMQLVQAPAAQLADLLAAGRFDAALALEPGRTALVNNGFVDVGNPFRALGDEVASAIYMATPAWIDENPGVIEKWIRAMEKSAEFIADNPDEAKALLVSEAELAQESVDAMKLATYTATIPDGAMAKWVDVMKQLGVLQGDVDVEALTYTAS